MDSNTNDEKLELLRSCFSNAKKMESKPPTAVRLNGKDFLRYGDFSVWKGQAKSRKSFAMAALMAGYLSEEGYMGFSHGKDVGMGMIVDTEESRYDADVMNKRVLEMAGLPLKKDLSVFGLLRLRTFSSSMRMELINLAIDTYRPRLLVIDGISDLVTNVNDPGQSAEIQDWLLTTTEAYGMHIACVLHTNEGKTTYEKARGWLGSEVTRKGQVVAMLTAEGDVSTISFPLCRGMRSPDPISFEIDEDGIPVLSEAPTPESKRGIRTTLERFDYPLKRVVLRDLLKLRGFSESRAYSLIKEAETAGVLVKEGGLLTLTSATRSPKAGGEGG